MEFRTDTIGSDGQPYRLALNRVDEFFSGGQHFAYINQTITLDYPGSPSTYRATAKQFGYNLVNGNLTNTTDFGEVGSVSISGQSFTDVGNDTVYQSVAYASLANANILDKPQTNLLSTDTAGVNVLRETLFSYDGSTGNLLQQLDQMCPTCFVTNAYGYDSYNNRISAANEAGIVTTTTYDSARETFPVSQTEGGTFTSVFSYDPRSGSLLTSTDPKGIGDIKSGTTLSFPSSGNRRVHDAQRRAE